VHSGQSGVLCIGTTTVDYTKKIDHLPEIESLVVIDEITRSTGGPGLNIAFNLRQLDSGLPVEAIGCLGQDSDAQHIIEQTELFGIRNTRMQRSGTKLTGCSDALTLNSNGKRTFLFHAGANEDLDFEAIDLDLHSPRILHVGAPGIHKLADSHSPNKPSQWVEVLARARESGIATNMEMVDLDVEVSRELVLPCLPFLSSIIINESEAGALVGTPIKIDNADVAVDWNSLEDLAAGLISLGVSQLAVVHTPAGVVAADSTGRTWRQGSVKVPSQLIKGTTGAGDACSAGIIYGLHEQLSIHDCLQLGVATAAQNIQSASSSIGVAPVAKTLAAANKFGYR
jgi:sugar/nucleoside kinase (ribokinase family)